MQVWNVLNAARWKCRTQKIAKKSPSAQLCRAISSQLRHISTIGKNLLSSNISPHVHNIVNFGPLAAEICWRVWGTPANFNGFLVLVALLHGILVAGVSQTLRRWTEGATYIRQGGHHAAITILVIIFIYRTGICVLYTSSKINDMHIKYCFLKVICILQWILSDSNLYYTTLMSMLAVQC